jgi:DNA-binding protein HU-beta
MPVVPRPCSRIGRHHITGYIEVNTYELIALVSERTGLRKSDVNKAVRAIFDAVGVALKRGDLVRLTGFGTFSTMQRKSFTGRNPRTGAPVIIKASVQPKFKPSKTLKDTLHTTVVPDRGGADLY